jgi:hypothetical protein
MSTPPDRPPPYREPHRAPSATDVQDRDRFQALADTSLARVQAAAESWRTGMAGLVSLITAGLFIKGPDAAQDLTTEWRVALTLLAGGGLAAATFGLWHALHGAVGVPEEQQVTDILHRHGSVAAFEVAQARAAAARLRLARGALKCALVLLGLAVLSWWWADQTPPSPPAMIQVTTPNTTICGQLVTADQQRIRVKLDGESTIHEIPFTTVQDLRLRATC